MEMQSPKITVEHLEEQDLQWAVDTAAYRMLTEELGRPELFNREHLFLVVKKGMDEGTVFVAKEGETPVGMLGALLFPSLFNPEIVVLAEVMWWVNPDHRKSRAGALLLKAFDDLGTLLKCEKTLSILPSSEINVQSLEKRGYLLEEYAFRKRYA